MSDKLNGPGVVVNTDRELWREPPGDYYANSIHVTESGKLGINVGGHVIAMSLRGWHEAAKASAAAEERGRRKGVEEGYGNGVTAAIEFLRALQAKVDGRLAPRDSGEDGQ